MEFDLKIVFFNPIIVSITAATNLVKKKLRDLFQDNMHFKLKNENPFLTYELVKYFICALGTSMI